MPKVTYSLLGRVYASITTDNSPHAHRNRNRICASTDERDPAGGIDIWLSNFLYLSIDREDWPRIVAAVEEALTETIPA